jgi:DNA-binding FrmR family transcriptional regulator
VGLRYEYQRNNGGGYWMVYERGGGWANCGHGEYGEEVARRIAACLNALDGIHVAVLDEVNAVPDVPGRLASLAGAADAASELIMDRMTPEQVSAALEANGIDVTPALAKVREAIERKMAEGRE